MKNSRILFGLFIFIVQFSFSQTESFTLEEAKSYALENHITISNSMRDVETAKKQIIETTGMGLPQININGNFNNFLNLPVQVMDASFFNPTAPPGSLVAFRAGTDYTSSANLEIGQLIFNGSYIIGLQAASYYAKFQENVTEVTKEEIIFNVISAYQLTSVAELNNNIADSVVILTQELVDKQQNYFELGLLLQEDMDQLNFSLLSAKQTKIAALVQYENAMNLLKFSMGFPVEKEIEISDDPYTLLAKETIGSGDIHTNLTYTMLEKQVKLSEYNLKNNKFANMPSLNAYFQHSYNAYRNEFDFFDTSKDWFSQTSWGLQLTVPVFSGGQRYAKTAQAKIRLMKDQDQLKYIEQSLLMQATQSKNNLMGARAQFELRQQNVALARSIYENQIEKGNIGNGNSIEVTQRYNQLMIALTQYVGSMVDLFQSQLELDKVYNNILQN